MAPVLAIAALLLLAAAPLCLTGGGDLVLKPLKSNATAEQVGVVVIQGAQITPDKYLPLIKQLQNISKYSLWVGVPEFPLDTPEPLAMPGAVKRILASMQSAGMPKTSKLFFVAHSLGGIILQDYLASNPHLATGQVLMGSFLLSKYRNISYPVPTMTLGGELDGLCRISRIMEEFYFRITHAQDADTAASNFPVLVIRGLSHIQFASGPPPGLVKLRDLKPEITLNDAHQIVASFVSSFLMVRMGEQRIGMMPIVDALHGTYVFLSPLVAAYELEGSYSLKPPCNSKPPGPSCAVGSRWSERAQQIMGGLSTASLKDSDAFHPVYQITPVHLPHVDSECPTPNSSCMLKTRTVTQNVYDELDKLDTGFVPISASEMRVKLKSRQAVKLAAGYKGVDFNTSDGGSLCAEINRASYEWAMKNASATALDRFKKHGVQVRK